MTKTFLIFGLLCLLVFTNSMWYAIWKDQTQNYNQELGLRDESDSLLRACQAGLHYENQ